MLDTPYKFPGKKGLLREKHIVAGSNGNIEIIREFNGSNLSVGLFDFDGTLSNERVGWPDLMIACNTAFLVALSSPHLNHKKAEKMVIEDIEKTIGIPTYLQMKRLRSMIEKNGYKGPKLDPQMFKDVYNNSLTAMVKNRHMQLANGKLSMNDLCFKGVYDLLKGLTELLPGGVYLATGSDVDAIIESVQELKFSEFFPPERIVGAGSLGPEDDTKEAIINNLLNEFGIKGNQLVTFGDGFPEILYTHRVGGIGVGILSPDHSHYEYSGHFTLEQKEERLINAGAHILVRNPYENPELLIEVLKQGYSTKR